MFWFLATFVCSFDRRVLVLKTHPLFSLLRVSSFAERIFVVVASFAISLSYKRFVTLGLLRKQICRRFCKDSFLVVICVLQIFWRNFTWFWWRMAEIFLALCACLKISLLWMNHFKAQSFFIFYFFCKQSCTLFFCFFFVSNTIEKFRHVGWGLGLETQNSKNTHFFLFIRWLG